MFCPFERRNPRQIMSYVFDQVSIRASGCCSLSVFPGILNKAGCHRSGPGIERGSVGSARPGTAAGRFAPRPWTAEQRTHTHTNSAFRWLGPFPTHEKDLWNGTPGPKRHFWAFGMGPSAENVGKSQGNCQNNAPGKMAVFGPFCGPWMATSCQQQSPCFDKFPKSFLCFFCIFSRSFHHFNRLCYPHLCIFLIFYYKYCTTQHTYSTQHTQYTSTHSIQNPAHVITPHHILHLFSAPFGGHGVCF